MGNGDTPAMPGGQSFADLLIVGAGIMGLWAAVHAERMGVSTLVVEAAEPGQGASGGLLGALMPHMPDRWSDKKQFQFDALIALEAEIAALEAETGLSAGYRRSGRLIPLPKPHLRTIALRHSRDADLHWRDEKRRFHWQVLDRPPIDGWIEPSTGTSGFVQDTLAARVAPRSLVDVLSAFVRKARHVRIRSGVPIKGIDPVRGLAFSPDGDIAFGHCILAAGYRSFPMLDALTSGLRTTLGQPVKGQAALLKAKVDPGLPVIFRGGLYIVPHENGQVAVGSTSENNFDNPLSTDHQLDDLVACARALVPSLAGADIIERWAGLRPKAIDRDPMVGAHPEHPAIIALTGGFKVSFGLAHRLAEAAVCKATGVPAAFELPSNFTLKSQIAVASNDA
jgi:glycine oxidase